MQGLDIKKNSQGHTVVRLHYSADPAKATKEWADAQSSKYLLGRNDLQWRSEYEIDFGAGSGELVFPEFSALEEAVVVQPIPVPHSWNLYGSLDWGNRNPVAFHVYGETPEKKFYCIWEYYCPGNETNVYEVAKVIKAYPYYNRIIDITFDPSMNKEDQQRKDGPSSSLYRMFSEELPEELLIEKLSPAHERNDMLCVNTVKQLFLADRLRFFDTCPEIITEFRNLKYPVRKETTNEPEKILDKDNHCWDNFKYFILSRPSAQILEEKHKFGTIGYLNKAREMAASISSETGESFQSVFNDLYGKEL